MKNRKLLKISIWLIGIILGIILLVILAISPIAKYLIEKYDQEYTGREIELDRVYINPFTGYASLGGVRIYEEKSQALFFAAKRLKLNFSLRKILSKTYEISQLTLEEPVGVIIQNKEVLNISDLIKKFSSDDKDTTKAKIRFSILNVKVVDGRFGYVEQLIPINYTIKKVNIESSGLKWDNDTIKATLSLVPDSGSGFIRTNWEINMKTLDYDLIAVVDTFDLQIIGQYLKDLTNFQSFTANLDLGIKAKGNFKEKEAIKAKGILAINDFHLGKNPKEDYASFERLVLSIKDLDPKGGKYVYDSLSIQHPCFKYEKYDHLDNIQMMFGKGGENVKQVNAEDRFNLVLEIAEYIKILAKNFFRSNYEVNRLAIYNADFKFNDYSLSEKFSVSLDPLTFIADSIYKSRTRVIGVLRSGLKPYGNLNVRISISPKDSNDFDLTYNLKKLPLTMFNPYVISYTSFPLDRGTIELNGDWKVRNGKINSSNHFLVIDPRSTSRVRNNDAKWIPVPLIMFFVRERGNVIDYEIPIKGDLKDPKFRLWDVLLDVVKNILIKPPTTPYSMVVKSTEKELEKSFVLNWPTNKNSFEEADEEFVHELIDYFKENPQVSITAYSATYTAKEKEYILFYEAKKKYFLRSRNKKESQYTEEDSLEVSKMSAKDSLFVKYIEKQINDPMLFTIQQKCNAFVGSSIVDKKYKSLVKQRENKFEAYFKDSGTRDRIKILAPRSEVPYNGFSYFKINYKDALPGSLIKAYDRMDKLNENIPRKKYREQRREIRKAKRNEPK